LGKKYFSEKNVLEKNIFKKSVKTACSFFRNLVYCNYISEKREKEKGTVKR
jgi:hypothetical protein